MKDLIGPVWARHKELPCI